MKKRILAVLLAVCMIAGTCALFASAADKMSFSASSYYEPDGKTISGAQYKDMATSSQNTLKVTEKSAGTGTISAAVWNNPENFTSSDLEKLCTITSSAAFDSAYNVELIKDSETVTNADKTVAEVVKVKISVRSSVSDKKVYKPKDAFEVEDKEQPVDQSKFDVFSKFTISNDSSQGPITVTIYKVKMIEQLHDLKVGLQFYGKNSYDNISATEIAQITASYKLINGAGKEVGNQITSNVNSIYDLYEGQTITLTAELKKEYKDSGDYKFKCWVDGSKNVLKRDDNVYTWTAGTSPNAIYAVFEELKSRIRINYSGDDHGKVAYEEANSTNHVIKRSILDFNSADGQLSVMEGHTVTFVFTPDDGYEVEHVYVDRKGSGTEVDVASFKSVILADGPMFSALKELINATGANKSFPITNTVNAEEKPEPTVYKFTFTKDDLTGCPDQIRSIRVVFAKANPLGASKSSKEMPSVEAEGITLATGAAEENAEAANGGNGATTVPAENGAAGSGSSPLSGSVVNPATGSTGAVTVFMVLSLAAGAAFVTAKKRKD